MLDDSLTLFYVGGKATELHSAMQTSRRHQAAKGTAPKAWSCRGWCIANPTSTAVICLA